MVIHFKILTEPTLIFFFEVVELLKNEMESPVQD